MTTVECRPTGIPILINEANSVFSITDFVDPQPPGPTPSPLRQLIDGLLPDIHLNLKATQNYSLLARLLLQQRLHRRVLVIGGRRVEQGMGGILSIPTIEFVETDVAFGPRTMLICDAHDLPFADGSFDGVIIQAVLEYLVDPYSCVEEIYRVLKDHGLIYAETPFMQQVHGAAHDFTRFTHQGHRRLFRRFEEVRSGAVVGPGVAFAWSGQYLLYSFANSLAGRLLMTILGRLIFSWFKYLDYYLIDKAGTLDAASGYYFMGRKSDRVLPDRELITLYRGKVAAEIKTRRSRIEG